MNQLFIAAISGNATARKYLYEFGSKFTVLDGAVSEDYKDMTAMLKQWQG